MTNEEKARAYDVALEQAKKELNTCGSMDCDAARQIFRFFPQLRESEDERIRKGLIEALKTSKTVGELKFVIPEPTREECVAYLEKQKEQDWNKKPCLTCQEYEKGHKQGYTEGCTAGYNKAMKEMEQKEPHFTKRNALFDKCVENCDPEIMKRVSDEVDAMLQKKQEPAKYLDKDMVYTIMKKLHDLSFSQLIPINSEEYKKIGEITSDVRSLLDYPIEQKPAEVDESTKRLNENWMKQHFDDYKEQEPAECIEFDNEFEYQVSRLLASVLNGEHKYNEGFVKYAAQSLLGYAKKELKPAKWSEEDLRMLSDIAGYISGVGSSSGITKRERVDFLYELPKRFNLQPKQEWSEEDERIRKAILGFLNPDKGGTKYSSNAELVEWSDWLKSLRPQPRWKPTEEQMKALSEAVYTFDGYEESDAIKSLYNELKKLM